LSSHEKCPPFCPNFQYFKANFLILRQTEPNQYVEEWFETNITGNYSFQWCFLTSSQVNWTDIKNYVAILLKKLSDINIDDNCLFEEIKRLNVHLTSDKLKQWKNQHVEIDKKKKWMEIFKRVRGGAF